MPEKVCEKCKHYWIIRIPAGNNKIKDTPHGRCQAKSRYAERSGAVYPPGSIVEKREYGLHKLVIVNKEEDASNCSEYTEK